MSKTQRAPSRTPEEIARSLGPIPDHVLRDLAADLRAAQHRQRKKSHPSTDS